MEITKRGLITTYLEHVFLIMQAECENLDSVYEDYIVHLVGTYGLRALMDNGYLETCGVINGRQLYTLLVNKPE